MDLWGPLPQVHLPWFQTSSFPCPPPPETSQVLGEQAEVHESPERLPVEPGGDQRSGGKVLHPRRL